MPTTTPRPNIERDLAQRLHVQLKPYVGDGALALIVLAALTRKGWEPSLYWALATRTWYCTVRPADPGDARRYYGSAPSFPQAVIRAAYPVLESAYPPAIMPPDDEDDGLPFS